jgi:hypothetical protein
MKAMRPFLDVLHAAVGAEGVGWMRLRQLMWPYGSRGFAVLATRS